MISMIIFPSGKAYWKLTILNQFKWNQWQLNEVIVMISLTLMWNSKAFAFLKMRKS